MMLPATVLLVDTDTPLRALYYRYLRNEGYQVILADSGHEAVKIMARTPPDVIVLEWVLRDWGSVEVLQRAIRQPPRIPVIVNTRYEPARNEYFAYLADRFLVKSQDVSLLLQAIHECLPEDIRKEYRQQSGPNRLLPKALRQSAGISGATP
jgi:DNA-binding NtrC family response regulator